MPILQVRDLPEELYRKLSYLAEKEHRSLAQQTIVLLREGVDGRFDKQNKRKRTLADFTGLGVNARDLPSPAQLIREDRDKR